MTPVSQRVISIIHRGWPGVLLYAQRKEKPVPRAASHSPTARATAGVEEKTRRSAELTDFLLMITREVDPSCDAW